MNPYYLAAPVLASGHNGLTHCLAAPAPSGAVGWALPPSYPRLPATLSAAVSAFRADTTLPTLLGEAFCSFWANSREWESLMCHTGGRDAEAVVTTLWERRRYFEIVG